MKDEIVHHEHTHPHTHYPVPAPAPAQPLLVEPQPHQMPPPPPPAPAPVVPVPEPMPEHTYIVQAPVEAPQPEPQYAPVDMPEPEPAAPAEPEPEPVVSETAFMIVVAEDGRLTVLTEVAGVLPIRREASLRDVRRFCTEVTQDLAAMAVAENVVASLSRGERPEPTQAEIISAALSRRNAESNGG